MPQNRPNNHNYYFRNWAIILIGLLLTLYLAKQFQQFSKRSARIGAAEAQVTSDRSDTKRQVDQESQIHAAADFLPTSTTGVVIPHKGFVLSYSETYEQAEWVAYVLTKGMLMGSQARRNDNFRADEAIRSYSATPEDYRASGYDRGHLCPASDMGYSESAMDETFLMSNISPQVRNFNGGIWRELEENIKDWAKKYQKVYVVTGPVLKKGLKYIGRYNKVAVPEAYYKVILTGRLDQSIAYVIPNQISDQRIETYACSIDEVEKQTNLNFFSHLLRPNQEMEVEARYNINYWPISERRYLQRMNEWNRR